MRALLAALLIPFPSFLPGGLAQNPVPRPVAANFEKREAEERYSRLNALVQNLTETQEVLLKNVQMLQERCAALERALDKTKEEHARGGMNLVTREELKRIVDMIKDVDAGREADRQLILKQLKDLAKTTQTPAIEPKNAPEPASEKSGEACWYKVEKGNTLSDIVSAYNAEFQKRGLGTITREQVLKANPGLKPDRILPGQKIRIPVPTKDE